MAVVQTVALKREVPDSLVGGPEIGDGTGKRTAPYLKRVVIMTEHL